MIDRRRFLLTLGALATASASGQYNAKPRFGSSPFTLGVVFWQTGRADEAVPLFKEAIARRTDYAEAHYMLAIALARRGKLDEAISQMQTAVRLQPNSEEFRQTLGRMQRLAGHSESE